MRTSDRSMAARVVGAEVSFEQQSLLRPLILSTGRIETLIQATATVRVNANGREVAGRGSIYLSDLWAWPDMAIDHAARESAMRAYCAQLAGRLGQLVGEPAHPLSLGLRLHEAMLHDESGTSIVPWPPALARMVCASPFDAAIHDAVGVATGRNAFRLYDDRQPIAEADAWFRQGTIAAIQEMLLDVPRQTSPVWWIVGKADDLERDVRPTVERTGCFAFKLKITGGDIEQDARRTCEVAQAARRWGIARPRLTIDSNEANPDAASVGAYLDILRRTDEQAYADLEMIEQPTSRDIEAHPFDWRPIATHKPVMVDEGLLSLEAMPIARDQGWSGFALKTCKGHSFALVAAAWAVEQGMLLSLQDLTNPGLSAIHAGLFAACVPTINGVELNSPQFTPDANTPWLGAMPGLFAPRAGVHQLPAPLGPGLLAQP